MAKKKKYSLTDEHRAQLKPWADKWISNALDNRRIGEDWHEVVDCVNGLYRSANLGLPDNVVRVDGPVTGAIVATISSCVWWLRKNPERHEELFGHALSEEDLISGVGIAVSCALGLPGTPVQTPETATIAATTNATYDATIDATNAATNAATDAATHIATAAATHAATHIATAAATHIATAAATNAATYDATADATHAATIAATNAATYDATIDATAAATIDATAAATRAATIAATNAATYDATADATNAATNAATDAATDAATAAATRAATIDATNAATNAATYDATRDATYDATIAATNAATADATNAATNAATYDATRDATIDATNAATNAATYDATRDATYDATIAATHAATIAATIDATADATDAATADATGTATLDGDPIPSFMLSAVQRWRGLWQGGSNWSGWSSYLSFFRHIAKLDIDYSNWHSYERLSELSGVRYMHENFTVICERHTEVHRDEQNAPHCETGPAIAWADGYSAYYWHGVKVPAQWIKDPESVDPATALTWENVEERRALCEILSWEKVLQYTNAKTIDSDPDPMVGTLLRVDLPDSPASQFLRVKCGTGRDFCLPVPEDMETAIQAQAWMWQVTESQYRLLKVRT